MAKVTPLKDGEEDLSGIYGDLDPFRWTVCSLYYRISPVVSRTGPLSFPGRFSSTALSPIGSRRRWQMTTTSGWVFFFKSLLFLFNLFILSEKMCSNRNWRKWPMKLATRATPNTKYAIKHWKHTTAVVQNLCRWKEGPIHNSVKPVLIEFHEPKDRNDLYSSCKEGLKKTGLVITEDSRSEWILTIQVP